MKITSPEDFWAGLMFIGFGVLAIVVAQDYPIGSAMRMGPGYFPTAIGACLAAIGAVVAVSGFKQKGEGIGRFPWRAILLLSAGFAAFAWGIDEFGFLASLTVLILLAAVSGKEYRWHEVLIETIVLLAGCWALFIYGLGLAFPLFPWDA
jgi:putative tricarboxylic transport membrane protein